ncbi:MAG TPA: hypothetical protein PKY96_00360 [Flavobacteriales bacterium]|nr:hypothetical protein [Flavobacteriales bacterium]HRD51076.1 hypothetical protein [Flavobacteriales bacterium]
MAAQGAAPQPAKRAWAWWLALTAVMLGVILAHFGEPLKNANAVLLSADGDGLKNYFTYAWHAEHGRDLLHFNGSGYPYGDHIFYTDGHPPLAWLIQQLPWLKPWKIGVLNVLLLLAPLGCAWALFAIGRRWGMAPWAAALAAVAISMLQPQVYRLGGHYALAHCWMFPATWYTLLRAGDAKKRWVWAFFTCALVLLALLTHPYLGLMSALFVASSIGVRALVEWRPLKQKRTYIDVGAMAVLPVAVFLALENASDRLPDRPETPPGADAYATRWQSLLVSTQPPMSAWVHPLKPEGGLAWESLCYLGIVTPFLLLAAIVVLVARLRKRGRAALSPDEPAMQLIAAALVLLFAMNVLGELLGDALPMLKQFRSTGRFAWAFYFVCLLFCAARAWQWLAAPQRKRRVLGGAVFALLMASYAAEGWPVMASMARSIGHARNVFDARTANSNLELLAQAVRTSGAAAVIPLPFPHGGSERYGKGAPERLHALAYGVAYRAGTPLMAGNLIRTSYEHARQLLALRAPRAFKKRVAEAIPPTAMLAILWSRDDLEPEEDSLWRKGAPLRATEAGELRLISAADLFAWDGPALRQRFTETSGHMVRQEGLWLESGSDSRPAVAYAAGPFEGWVSEFIRLMELDAAQLDTSVTYELCAVVRAIDGDAVNSWLIIEHGDPDGKVDWEGFRDVRSMPMQLHDRTIAAMPFRPKRASGRYRVMLGGPEQNRTRAVVEHVLFRPLATQAWRTDAEGLHFNNIPVDDTLYAAPLNRNVR